MQAQAFVDNEQDFGGHMPHVPVDAREQDAYWQAVYFREHYYRAELDYEDYAPAYCVGYIGFAQYGGDYDDAEKSLCANWLRIKGDSRLSLDDARLAMRAAWDRMADEPALGSAFLSQRSFEPVH